jgi:hypothetical protein
MSDKCLGQIAGDFRVSLGPIPKVIPLGGSLLLNYEITNQSEAEMPLDLDFTGKPNGVLRCQREGGVNLKPTGPMIEHTTGVMPKAEVYLVKPGESIGFKQDLGVMFGLRRTKAGKHLLYFAASKGKMDSREFQVVDTRSISAAEVSGTFETPSEQLDSLGKSASLRLCLIESLQSDKTRWIVIDDLHTGGVVRAHLPLYWREVEPDSVINRWIFDYRGQLWVHLIAKDRSTVLAWKINDLSWTTVFTSTPEHVTLGATQAKFNVPSQIFAVATKGGATSITTDSVSSGDSPLAK